MRMPPAVPLRDRKFVLADGTIIEVRVWLLPAALPPCTHHYKYSLFYGYPGRRLVGYDNERGKGDHKHVEGIESPYEFTNIERLLADFARDVQDIRREPI